MSDIFSFGDQILETVAPVFNLFQMEGFAPFLASMMLAIAIFLEGCIYVVFVFRGKIALNKIVKILQSATTQVDFSSRFNEIDIAFNKTKLLKHGWGEFCETLIKPDQESNSQIIRNTIRPNFYMSIHEIESKMHLRLLHFASNTMVGVGLLFTFIGLVAALTFAMCGISDQVTGALAHICTHVPGENGLDAAIKKLLHAASLKFWTSVSGLGCSIILRILYGIHYNGIKNILQKINTGLERGLQFVTPEYLAVEHLREAQEQSAAMKRFSQDLAMSLADKIQTGFTTALTPVHDSLREIGNRITGGIGDAIKGAAGSEMEQLARNMGGVVESLTASRAEMDGMGAAFRMTMAEAAEALKSASGEASTEMSQKLQEVVTTLAEEGRQQTKIFNDSMKQLSTVLDKAGMEAGETVQHAANNLASGMNGVSDGVRDAAGVMAERMTELSDILLTVEERMSLHIRALDAVTERARDTEQAMGVTSRHLTETAIPVTQAGNKMATAAEQLNMAIQGAQKAMTESRQSFVGLAEKMSETQQILQNAWQSYDKRFADVDESLEKAVRGIVGSVGDNIKLLEQFVSNMDKNLGQTMSIFTQNIDGLNKTAEDFEKATENLLIATDRITGDTKIA